MKSVLGLGLGVVATFLFSLKPVLAAGEEALETSGLKMPVFIILGVITVLLIIAGFATRSQLFGVVGSVLFFLLAVTIMVGNLSYQSGETEYHNETTNETVTTYNYQNWDTGEHRMVGLALGVLSMVLFAVFLMGGEE